MMWSSLGGDGVPGSLPAGRASHPSFWLQGRHVSATGQSHRQGLPPSLPFSKPNLLEAVLVTVFNALLGFSIRLGHKEVEKLSHCTLWCFCPDADVAEG